MDRPACSGCVLVVDDDGDVRDALSEHFQRLGCRVLVAADGLDALDALARRVPGRPCFILTDLDMPGLDGVGLSRIVRGESEDTIPLVTMSAHEGRDRPPGVDAHLPKPFSVHELERTVARHCRKGLVFESTAPGDPRLPPALASAGPAGVALLPRSGEVGS